ncbi:hypothetical protein CPB83DRAFT_756646 [Crepidotus variabilis]|uniref:NADAR domain-containing protein n=1 Tax=Crepidotus variabilis TaxID=179855 RepID=A0A9P6JVZ3_9AGAR|nr:hypothetical protein CPB83DRAFT_756646 [Crepidotus variabilis]
MSRKSGTNTINIVTSPPSNPRALPNNSFLPAPSPTTTKQAPIYRIEERSRTIYVASDVDPSQWDANSLNTIFTLAEVPELDGDTDQPIRRTQSYSTTQVLPSPQTSERSSSDDSATSPRYSVYRSPRRQGVRSAGAGFPIPSNPRVSTMNMPSPQHASPKPRGRILFYHRQDPHYGFTNFSAHPVIYNGRRYPTSEHLFQSFKFQEHRPNLAEHIRTCSERPSVAFSEARRFQPEVRPDWKNVNIEKMDITLYHKFTQHPDLKGELLATGDAELVEVRCLELAAIVTSGLTLTMLYRIPTRMPFGALEQMAEAGTNLERPLRD